MRIVARACSRIALATGRRDPWLIFLLAQIYVMAGQGEPHCQPLSGPAAPTGDWPRDQARWLERADLLLVSDGAFEVPITDSEYAGRVLVRVAGAGATYEEPAGGTPRALDQSDALLATVQMPAGIPVATLAIGKAGAINAALLSASILGAKHPQFHAVLKKFRAEQTDSVLDNPDPRVA